MNRSMSRRVVMAGVLLLAARPARAQTADTLRLTADFGFVNTSGNTDLTTFNVGEKVEWQRRKLTLAQSFAVIYGRSNGETTSSLWRGTLRGDYALSPAVAAYLATAYDRDRFAGVARRFEEGAGLAIGLLRRTRDQLEVEGGVSLVQQRSVLGTGDDFFSARGAGKYVHHFTETTYFQQALEVLSNLESTDDVRLTSESAVVAPLSRRLALKVSYVVRFDNVPEPGFGKADRLLTSALQFTL
ncbi:MAG: DUF481 domain-containing protein [Gemmatimonadales bacterium]